MPRFDAGATVEALTPQLELIGESLAAYVGDREAMRRACRIAERYARLPRDSYLARELVADVIHDLAVGDLRCDPARPIASQLERYVQRRGARLREPENLRRPRRPRFVSLDEAPSEALSVDAHLLSLLDDGQHVIDFVEWVARIRMRASGDDGVQQLLALYDQEVFSRRDVLDAGMTEWAHRAARERLVDYATAARADMLAISSAPPESEEVAAIDARAVAPMVSTAGSATRPARASRVVVRRLGRARGQRSA